MKPCSPEDRERMESSPSTKGGWLLAAIASVLILGNGLQVARLYSQRWGHQRHLTAAQGEHHPGRAVLASEPARPAVVSQESQLTRYQDITRLRTRDDEQLLLLTFAFPDQGDGIKCVDAVTGSVKWHQEPVSEGRYTTFRAGDTTLVECTGWPGENYLAVRRLSDGRVLGRPWTLGRLYDVAISGRRVAAVEPVVIHHGREVAVTSLGAMPEGHEATRVRVYDEWGHVLSSRHVPDGSRLFGFPRGFAVVSDRGTTILTRSGRRVVTLH
jgi:hypothetical protein